MSAAGPDLSGSGALQEVGAGAVTRPGAERLLLGAALLGLCAAAAVLWLIADQMPLLPTICPVRRLTGLYCPGCGSTRAAAAVLHGDLLAALDYNPLAMAFAPILFYAGLKQAARMLTGRTIPRRHIQAHYIWALLGLICLYAILRNLPWEPFALLAP